MFEQLAQNNSIQRYNNLVYRSNDSMAGWHIYFTCEKLYLQLAYIDLICFQKVFLYNGVY